MSGIKFALLTLPFRFWLRAQITTPSFASASSSVHNTIRRDEIPKKKVIDCQGREEGCNRVKPIVELCRRSKTKLLRVTWGCWLLTTVQMFVIRWGGAGLWESGGRWGCQCCCNWVLVCRKTLLFSALVICRSQVDGSRVVAFEFAPVSLRIAVFLRTGTRTYIFFATTHYNRWCLNHLLTGVFAKRILCVGHGLVIFFWRWKFYRRGRPHSSSSVV